MKTSPRKKPLIIVGVSASHDASACVLIDGVVKRAIQLERITRIKHDGVPSLSNDAAIHYCLASLGLSISDVDAFAFNIQSIAPGYHGLKQPLKHQQFSSFDPFSENAFFVSHHLAHAFCGYGHSGFDRAKVIVADGSGGVTKDGGDMLLSGPEFRRYLEENCFDPQLHTYSEYIFDASGYSLVKREFSKSYNVRCGSSSAGETYAAVANYLFNTPHAAGKVMGLAPYGNYGNTQTFLSGLSGFGTTWKESFTKPIVGDVSKDPISCDLAARVQKDLEELMLSKVSLFVKRDEAMVFSGGVAMNCKLNQLIRQNITNNFFVPSAPGDAGISIGCAFALHYKITGVMQNEKSSENFWGHPYSEQECYLAINAYKNQVASISIGVKEVAALLSTGKVIGLFDSSSEFGPRALGHRSILADPREKDMWSNINNNIKRREDFRPFAPISTLDNARKYFVSNVEHAFMTETVFVNDEYKKILQAVTHVDGTARLQTITREVMPYLHSLLKEFGEITGVEVLLNTSMNIKGQPIVESPEEAVQLLIDTPLDGMYFPALELFVYKTDYKQDIENIKRCAVSLSKEAAMHLVYSSENSIKAFIVGRSGEKQISLGIYEAVTRMCLETSRKNDTAMDQLVPALRNELAELITGGFVEVTKVD